MKRLLSFVLGIIFSLVFVFGAVGIVLYSSVAVVHPNEVYVDMEQYLGKLGDMSLLQAYYDIIALYEEKTGVSTDKLYSVGDFLKDNEIAHEQDGKTVAFGIEMPTELLDAPLFEYFNGTIDENGDNGVQRALRKIKVGTVPAIVNMFATPTEDGTQIVDQEVVDKLNQHSMYDLVYGDALADDENATPTTKIVANLSVVLEGISLDQLLPIFDEEQTDNALKTLMTSLGQADIGKLIAGLTSNDNLLGMLKDDGALASIGQLKVTDILGESDALLSGLLGNVTFADFIAENGDLAIVQALNSVSLAPLFGLVKRQMNFEKTDSDFVVDYFVTTEEGTQLYVGTVASQVVDGEKLYYISENANTAEQTIWYQGKLACNVDEHAHTELCGGEGVCNQLEHIHQFECYSYLWYQACKDESEEHDHSGEITFNVGGEDKPFVPAGFVYSTIANLKFASLFDENGAFGIDKVLAMFDNCSLDELINDLLADNEMLTKLSDLLDLKNTTLSDLLAEGGFDQLLSKVFDAPIVEIMQTFGLGAGLEAITGILGDMSITDLTNGGFDKIELAGLLGLIKRPMDIDVASMSLLQLTTTTGEGEQATTSTTYVAKQVDGENTYYYLSTNYDPSADTTAEGYVAPTWYEGLLDCANESHDTFDKHDLSCFGYQFYQVCENAQADHVHQTTDVNIPTTDENGVQIDRYCTKANFLYNVLGNLTVGGIMNGGIDSLMNKLTSIKLGDLFSSLGMTLDGTLGALADLSIEELTNGGYGKLTLGSLLGRVNYTTELTNDDFASHSDLHRDGNYVMSFGETKSGQLVIKYEESSNIYTYAKINCSNELHTDIHDENCYQPIWYILSDSCRHDKNEHIFADCYTEESGLFAVLVNLTLDEIMGNPNKLMESVFDIKLGELLTKDDLEGLMATLADYTINDLMNPETINNLALADILGYTRTKVDNVEGWTQVIAGNDTLLTNGTDFAMSQIDDNGTNWYKAHKTCKLDLHVCDENCETPCDKHKAHDVDCYGFVWYDEGEQVTGLYSVLADLSIGSLMGGADIMTTLTTRLTLGDVFPAGVPEMLKSLAGVPIANLEQALTSTKVGDLLGYTFNTETSTWQKGGVDVTGIEQVLAGYSINDLQNLNSILDTLTLEQVFGEGKVPTMLNSLKDTPIGELETAIDDIYVGEFMGYTKNGEIGEKFVCDHIDDSLHTESCSYVTYKWLDKNNAEVVGIMAKLANEKISTLGSIADTVQTFTLTEVFGGEDKVPSILKGIANSQIKDLESNLNTMYLGDLLGNQTKVATQTDVDACTTVAVTQDGNAVVKHNDDKSIIVILDQGEWKYATIKCVSDGCAHDKIECYGYVWYKNNAKVTDITAKLSNEKIGDLGNIGTTIQNYTLADVMPDVPQMLQSIKDTPIKDLSNAINKMYVGDLLGYVKGDQNGYVYLDGHTAESDHTNCNCYPAYHWTQEGGGEVSGIMTKIANKKVDNLSSISNDIQDFKIGDIITKEQNPSPLMSMLYETQVKDVSTTVNNMYLGTAMGYYRKTDADGNFTEVDGDGNYTWYTDKDCTMPVQAPTKAFVNSTVTNIGTDIDKLTLGDLITDDSSTILNALKDSKLNTLANDINSIYIGTAMGFVRLADSSTASGYEEKDGVVLWYAVSTTCAHADDAHLKSCYTEQKGLNAKMSNLTIGGMNGTSMLGIVTNLTMGEMIDSGILSFDDPEDMHKIAIIYCGGSSKHNGCGIFDFLLKKNLDPTLTAEEYFQNCHPDDGEGHDYEYYEALWKQEKFTDFINILLDAIDI